MNQKTKPFFSNLLLLLAAIYFLALAGGCAAKDLPEPKNGVELNRLLSDIHKIRGDDTGMYSWLMNSEHLFVGSADETLRDRSIAFCREPGSVDLLFDRLSSPDASPAQVVMYAEILVYYGEYDQPGDENLKCTHVPDEKNLLSSNQIMAAIKVYSDAPIKEVLHYSLKKASGV